jgi:hypothetical protein
LRLANPNGFINEGALTSIGLSHNVVKNAIQGTYNLLDQIDATLITAGVFPLSQTVELANFSSMIGNIFASAIATHSEGLLQRNGPHKYPDLLKTGSNPLVPNIELKMALEDNQPKGHLAKEGHYLTCRYVLCEVGGDYVKGKNNRGSVPYIWEIRCGYLKNEHFNISNTAGDSGKTAVVNAAGMKALHIIYIDIDRVPHSEKGSFYKAIKKLLAD